MQRIMQEIMERAIGEMREALAQEVDEGEAGHWDPDAWEVNHPGPADDANLGGGEG